MLNFGANILCAVSQAYGTMSHNHREEDGTLSASDIQGFDSPII